MTVTASRQIGALEDRYPEKAILYLNPVSSSWGPQLGVAAVPGKAAKMLSVSTGQDHTRIRITSFKHDPDTGQVLLTATVKAKSP
ncbi:MAG: hypothetical protein NTY53_18440, partial [Kiritimatiellaeota bacterium]|nr:hypothetical protein [Kiritimatiellota bacterium]